MNIYIHANTVSLLCYSPTEDVWLSILEVKAHGSDAQTTMLYVNFVGGFDLFVIKIVGDLEKGIEGN